MFKRKKSKKYKDPQMGGSLAIPDGEVALLVQAIMSRIPKRKSKYFYFCNIRDSMMILMGGFLGMRSKNYIQLEMNELNLDTRQIYIPPAKSKTGKQDILIIPRCLIPRLKLYLAVRKKFFPKSKWVFPAIGHKNKDIHIDRNTFLKMFRNALKKAGLYHVKYIDKQGNKRASRSSHGLRKGAGTKVWLITGDIEKTSIFLTQTDSRRRSTFRYIQAAKEQIRHQICDEVFDQIWKDEAKIHTQKEKLIKLLELSQNRHVPIVKI